jgi:hypothetical protein
LYLVDPVRPLPGQWTRVRGEMRSRKALRLFRSPEKRDRILNGFNHDDMDDLGPVRGDQGRAVRKDINELQAKHDEFVNSLGPTMNVRRGGK